MTRDNSAWPQGQPYPGLDVSFIEPVSLLSSAETSVGATNTAWLSRFRVAAPLTIDTISIYIGSNNSGNVDAGIYEASGSDLTLSASAGTTAAGTVSTVQDLTLSRSVPLSPGTDYWLAVGNSASALHLSFSPASGGMPASAASLLNRWLKKSSSFPLPATIASPSAADFAVWAVARSV